MATITDALVMGPGGSLIDAQCYGNNLAMGCPDCGHPILLTAREGWPGSGQDKPTICPNQKCGRKTWITSPVQSGVIVTTVTIV